MGMSLEAIYDALYAITHVHGVEVEQESQTVVTGAEITQKLRHVA